MRVEDKGRSTGAGRRIVYVGAVALVAGALLIVGIRKATSIAPPDAELVEESEEAAAPGSDPESARVVEQVPRAEQAPPSPEAAPSPAPAEPGAAADVAVAPRPPGIEPPRPAPLPVRTAEEQRKLTNEDEWTPPYVPTPDQEARLRENDPPEPPPGSHPPAGGAAGADPGRPDPRLSDDEEEPKPRVLTHEQRRLLQDD